MLEKVWRAAVVRDSQSNFERFCELSRPYAHEPEFGCSVPHAPSATEVESTGCS
jgi:hypothetical protein